MAQTKTPTARLAGGLAPLLAAAGFGALAQSLAGPAGALLAADLAGAWSTGLPQGSVVAGSALAAVLIGRFAPRIGRATALAAGTALGVLGCALVIAGALAETLIAVAAGSVLFGASNASVMLSRYAASARVTSRERARAMATVLSGTTVGSVLGPNLLAPASEAGRLVGLPSPVGAYAVGALGLLAATTCFLYVGRAPRGVGAGTDPARTAFPAATGRRDTAVGIGVLALINLVMVGVMTGVPLHLEHLHAPLAVTGLVVSMHIAAMFAPSPWSARVVDRFGARPAAFIAGLVLLGSLVGAVLLAASVLGVAIAMLLLGGGWNLGLLAGSSLLAGDGSEAERTRREGWGEVGMGFTAAGGGVGSGFALEWAGFPALAIAGGVAAGVLALWTAIEAGASPKAVGEEAVAPPRLP